MSISTGRMLAGSLAISLGAASLGQAAESAAKNWTPPPYRTLAQALADQTMAAHPELLSMTFHGVPPGMDKTYTMFAGSYPDRVGNPDDPDDIDVIVKGITIVDPRWKRMHDPSPKVVIQAPLRDAAGQNVGLVVYAFKSTAGNAGERRYFTEAMDLRDALEPKIPTYQALFDKAP